MDDTGQQGGLQMFAAPPHSHPIHQASLALLRLDQGLERKLLAIVRSQSCEYRCAMMLSVLLFSSMRCFGTLSTESVIQCNLLPLHAMASDSF